MITSELAEAFHEGGWPMFPIAVLGVLTIIAAGRYAAQPTAGNLRVARSLSVVTLIMGVLGATLGMIHCLTAIGQVPTEVAVKFALLGLGESLNNVGFALLQMVVAGLVASVGALRASESP